MIGRACVGAAALLALGPVAGVAADDAVIARVLIAFGADRDDVRACLVEQVRAEPRRRAEIERLADVVRWIETSLAQPRASSDAGIAATGRARSDAFAEIVATFNHERRLDGARLEHVSQGALTPRHVSTYARIVRALGSGHDARRVLCGL